MKLGPREPIEVPVLPDLTCPECGDPMRLVETFWSDHPWQWRCVRSPLCSGTHGAHPDGSPLGVPGDSLTKAARAAAHDVFDRLWKSGAMSRGKAYQELDAALGSEPGGSHFGAMPIAECQRAQAWAAERLKFLQEIVPKTGSAERSRVESIACVRRAQHQRNCRGRSRRR